MPNYNVFPLSGYLLSGATATTTGTVGSVLSWTTDTSGGSIKMGQSYRFTVELLTASSTTTNFNLSLFTSSDGGTTYHGFLAFTALTTSGQGQSALLRPYMGVGDTATIINAPILGTTDYASNTQVVANGPFDPRFVKARVLCATTGTVTYNLKLDIVVPGIND